MHALVEDSARKDMMLEENARAYQPAAAATCRRRPAAAT